MTIKRRAWIVLTVFLLITGLLLGHVMAAGSNGDSDVVHLQIFTVNDFHGALIENAKNPGAAKLVSYLKEAKARDREGTIIVSAGDMFQGTADSNLLYGKNVVDMMNCANFDVMTFGNHEFDWGIDVLKQRIAQSKFPYVCANIIDRSTGKPIDFDKPYIILNRSGLKIAVIGIATPDTAYKTNPKVVAGYYFEEPSKVVNALVPELKLQGVDVIVVLAHLASWMGANGNISGDAATLARQAEGIDAIVTGHSHQTVYGKVNGVAIVQANCNGRFVGKFELYFNKSSHQVSSSTVSVISLPFSGLTSDTEMLALLDKSAQELIPIKNITVGQTVHELRHDRNEFTETLLGQWVTDAMRQAAGADIAFQNTGGLRKGIDAGTITMGNLYEVMPFDNTLVTVEMTGQQVMKILEYGIMNQKVGMVQYSGINVFCNVAGSKKTRIISITMSDGRPLLPDKTYKVVTNDFMAAGGDGFTMFKEGKNFHDTNISLRDILADNLRKVKIIDFVGDSRWNIMEAGKQLQNAA